MEFIGPRPLPKSRRPPRPPAPRPPLLPRPGPLLLLLGVGVAVAGPLLGRCWAGERVADAFHLQQPRDTCSMAGSAHRRNSSEACIWNRTAACRVMALALQALVRRIQLLVTPKTGLGIIQSGQADPPSCGCAAQGLRCNKRKQQKWRPVKQARQTTTQKQQEGR
jgi:hypothetical protein